VVETLREQGQPVVYHLSQRDNYMVEDVPAHEVPSSIVYQLLCLKPEILRDRKRFEDLSAKMRGSAWRTDDISVICGVLRELFKELGRVYVVLDRVDRCKCRGRTQRLVETLLEAVEKTDCTVKILLLIAPNRTGQVEIDVAEESVEKRRYVEIDRWDQQGCSPRRNKRFQ